MYHRRVHDRCSLVCNRRPATIVSVETATVKYRVPYSAILYVFCARLFPYCGFQDSTVVAYLLVSTWVCISGRSRHSPLPRPPRPPHHPDLLGGARAMSVETPARQSSGWLTLLALQRRWETYRVEDTATWENTILTAALYSSNTPTIQQHL